MDAENAYLFRHALLRDAGYQLQPQSQRQHLHGLAFAALEQSHGGCPPQLADLDQPQSHTTPAHATDAVAAELAEHARLSASPGLALLEKHYLQRAAEQGQRNFQHAMAAKFWQRLAELESGVRRAEALRRAAHACNHAGRTGDAESLLRQALALCGPEHSPRIRAAIHDGLAGLLRETGRVEQAESGLNTALELLGQAGDQRATASAVSNLASLYLQTGRNDQAQRLYEQALAIHTAIGNRDGECVCLTNLAGVHFEAGNLEQAEQIYRQVLQISREIGDRPGEGFAVGGIALVIQQRGRLEQAEAGYAQSIAIHREVGNRRSEAIGLGNLANLQHLRGRRQQAIEGFEQSIAILREIGNRRPEGIFLGHLAGVLREVGRLHEAGLAFQAAADIHREVKNDRWLAMHQCDSAWYHLATGNEELARQAWQEGMSLLRKLGLQADAARHQDIMLRQCAEHGLSAFAETPRAGSGLEST